MTTAVAPAVPAPPSWLRRFAAGAWHVPGAALFLLQRPRLWPLAALPSLLGLLSIGGGTILGVFAVRAVDGAVAAYRPKLPDLVDLFVVVGVWTSTLAAGVLAALSIVLLLSAPLLDCLGRRAEAMAGGTVDARLPRLRDLPALSARSFYLMGAVPVALAVGVVPFVGPLAAAFVVVVALAVQETAVPLARRGFERTGLRRWHRDWQPESLGFGAASLVLLPLVSPILVPTLAIGGALLVQEIEDVEKTAAAPAPVSSASDSFEETFTPADAPPPDLSLIRRG